MRLYKNSIVLLGIICFMGCKNVKDETMILKEYGYYEKSLRGKEVELDFDSFKNFKSLVTRLNDLACSDSVSQINIKNGNIKKVITLSNICYMKYGCVLIKQRNVIEIHNERVFKYGNMYPLDSLKNLMKREYFNKNMSSSYCENPDKFLIRISYDDDFDSLRKLLNMITDYYDDISPGVSLKLWLENPILVMPPPSLLQK